MEILLFDGPQRVHLLPFTFTRPVGDLRCGIYTFAEKWKLSGFQVNGFITESHLEAKFTGNHTGHEAFIYGGLAPTLSLVQQIEEIKDGEGLFLGEMLLAFRSTQNAPKHVLDHPELLTRKPCLNPDEVLMISRTWHLFSLNGRAIHHDFQLIQNKEISVSPSSSNKIIGTGNLFIHPSASVEGAIINLNHGPVYVGAGAEIMEGSVVRGPLALCEGSALKLSTKVYGPTTIGPHSKAGGELNNVVIYGYSNKGHDGFLGNAVLGEWVNIGADTNNSNLKNNYEEVKAWSYATQKFEKTGLTFCGLMMGDHSKCGINTMFNTGTVVGVAANIFGAGFPRNFVPSFSWGGAQGLETFRLPKVYEMARQMMSRRNIELSEEDKNILNHIYESTSSERTWENPQKNA